MNELATVADDIDVDVWEAIQAANTKRFDFQSFYVGAGAGGHCTLVDPQFLSWCARKERRTPDVIESVSEVDDKMPAFVATRIRDALRSRGVSPNEPSVLGLTYKPNCRRLPELRRDRRL